ncbi:MAG: mechanosensitive ion channel family protein [Bacteriovoracaceae bacterium]
MSKLLPNPYLLAIGIFLLSYIIIYGLKKIFTFKLTRFLGEKARQWDDLVISTLEETKHFFMTASALYISYQFLPSSPIWNLYISRTYFIFLMIQIGLWSNHLFEKWMSKALYPRMQKNPAVATSISLIQLLFKMTLFTLILLFTLHNIGIKITTIIAGLGVGGIAVALGLQKILGDLFSSLSIVLDRPFIIGDFVVLDQYMGEVEKIGLKTTRIRSLSGEQIIISNSDLLATRIRNFKRMRERRIAFIMRLPFQTSTHQLKSAVQTISSIVSSQERVRFERCHFMNFGTHSLEIETVYWILHDDYNIYMDIQQKIFFEIHDAFSAQGLKLAYQTQMLHFDKEDWPKLN